MPANPRPTTWSAKPTRSADAAEDLETARVHLQAIHDSAADLASFLFPPTAGGVWALPGRMKVREVIRVLEDDGWQQVAQRGSHRQFRHPTKPGRVTVAGNPGQDMAPGTLGNIWRQARLSKEAP